MAKYRLQMTVPITGNAPDADFGDPDLRSSILSKGGVVHGFLVKMANSWSGVPLISSFGGGSLQYSDDGLSSQPIGEIDGDPYVAVTKLQSERAGRGFGVNAPPIDQEYMRELLHSGLPHLDRPHGYPGSSAGNASDHWMMFVCFLYSVIFVTAIAFALISWKFQKNRNEAWDCEQKIEWDTEVEKAEEVADEEGGGEGFEGGEGGA